MEPIPYKRFARLRLRTAPVAGPSRRQTRRLGGPRQTRTVPCLPLVLARGRPVPSAAAGLGAAATACLSTRALGACRRPASAVYAAVHLGGLPFTYLYTFNY